MICKDFREIIDSYLSDELLTETNHDVISHMENCSDCRGVIEARREFRSRLKSAVTSSSNFELAEGFDHKLLTKIRYDLETTKKSNSSWFGMRLIATAAAFLVVAALAFAFFANSDRPDRNGFMVAGFSENSLINIATGDHQHCAIKHDLEEAPIALTDAGPHYQGLDKLVEKTLSGTLPDHKLIGAHACKYKDVRFAHFVLKSDANTVSVLIARDSRGGEAIDNRFREFSSADYEVTSFQASDETVFVISDDRGATNRKTAESLAGPFEEHFSNKAYLQTALFRGLSDFNRGPVIRGEF